jgi:uncharacterized protein (DUF2062 family)
MRGRLRQWAQILLHLEDTPHRTALAFGIGVFIAFFPLLGIHTLMALGIAFLFGLNRVAMLLGCYVNNPWTLAPLYLAGTAFGCALLGVSPEGLGAIDWELTGRAFYVELFESLRPYLWPYVVGNTLLGLLAGAAGYFALRWFLERRRRGAGQAA